MFVCFDWTDQLANSSKLFTRYFRSAHPLSADRTYLSKEKSSCGPELIGFIEKYYAANT